VPTSRIFYGLALLPLVAVILFAALRPLKVLPRIRISPGYMLVDQNGNRVSSEEMRGQITLYSFTSTNCGLPCAGSEGVMADVAAQLQPQSDVPVELVTIAVDEQALLPDTLRAYALGKGIEPTRRLLTGEAQQVKLVVGGGFSTFYERDSRGQLQLDPALMLVDGLGILRAKYRGRLPSPSTILRDIDLLTQEARNSTGLTRYAYEAAHLFLCYP
jgi:protein SCO1/2